MDVVVLGFFCLSELSTFHHSVITESDSVFLRWERGGRPVGFFFPVSTLFSCSPSLVNLMKALKEIRILIKQKQSNRGRGTEGNTWILHLMELRVDWCQLDVSVSQLVGSMI